MFNLDLSEPELVDLTGAIQRVAWNKGKTHTPEARAKMSELAKKRVSNRIGKKHSAETIQNYSFARKGVKHFHGAKISAALSTLYCGKTLKQWATVFGVSYETVRRWQKQDLLLKKIQEKLQPIDIIEKKVA